MEKYQLAEEIIDFCSKYYILGTTIEKASASNIVEQLEEVSFVEHLMSTIEKNAKYKKNIDIKKLKVLLNELDKIRLDFEYGE